MVAENELDNFDTFRNCLSTVVIAKLCPSPSKSRKKRVVKGRKHEDNPLVVASFNDDDQATDANDLGDFVEVSRQTLISLSLY